MRKGGDYHFAAARLGGLTSRLSDGCSEWVGAASAEFQHSLVVVKQGHGKRGRTTKEGRGLSITATGDGDEDLVRKSNLLPKGLMGRTNMDKEAVPNFRFFKISKSNLTAVRSADGDLDQEIGAPQNDQVTVIRGTSWVSLFLFYFAKAHGAMTYKIPGIFLALVLLSKTIGV